MNKYVVLIIVMLFAINTSIAFAQTSLPNDSDSRIAPQTPDSAVRQMVECINQNDWDGLADLNVSSEKEAIRAFTSNPVNLQQHNGILNVKSAELIMLSPISNKILRSHTNNDYLVEEYSEVYPFVICLGMTVHEYDNHFFDGINYFCVQVVKEEGEFRIAAFWVSSHPQFLEAYHSSMHAERNLGTCQVDSLAIQRSKALAVENFSEVDAVKNIVIPAWIKLYKRPSENEEYRIEFRSYCEVYLNLKPIPSSSNIFRANNRWQ